MDIIEKDSDAVCQPGVGWMELNEKLKDQGQYRPLMCVSNSNTITTGIPLFFPVRYPQLSCHAMTYTPV